MIIRTEEKKIQSCYNMIVKVYFGKFYFKLDGGGGETDGGGGGDWWGGGEKLMGWGET